MGFLSGSYGKIMAGKLVRTLQNELTSVTSRYNRVTKQVGDLEEMFQRAERRETSAMNLEMNGYRNGILSISPATQAVMSGGYQAGLGQAAAQELQQYQMGLYDVQSFYYAKQSAMAEYFDMMREVQLEPLKAIQDTLETRKDNLESRLQLAKGQYEAKKKEEQDGAKNAVPDYTGSGS